MPEGPEVQSIRQSLQPFVVDQTVSYVFVGNKPLRKSICQDDFANLLNCKITSMQRHGKLLWLVLGENKGIHFRLGMTGRLTIDDKHSPKAKHLHVRIGLCGNNKELRYEDPRRFGEVVPFFDDNHINSALKRMGPDPFYWDKQERNQVADKIMASGRNIKNILLDQSIIAGIGNIYASEALFYAKISPFIVGGDLDKRSIKKLLACVERVLKTALRNNGTTFSSYVDGTGKSGSNLQYLAVFQKANQPCTICQRSIIKITQSGRSTFYCENCQK